MQPTTPLKTLSQRVDAYVFTHPLTWTLARSVLEHYAERESIACQPFTWRGVMRDFLTSKSACRAENLALPARVLADQWESLGTLLLDEESRLERIVKESITAEEDERLSLRVSLGRTWYDRISIRSVNIPLGMVRDTPASILLTYHDAKRKDWQRETTFLIISYAIMNEETLRLDQVQGARLTTRGRRWTPFVKYSMRAFRGAADTLGFFLARSLGMRFYAVFPAFYREQSLIIPTQEMRERLYKRYDAYALEHGFTRNALGIPIKPVEALQEDRGEEPARPTLTLSYA